MGADAAEDGGEVGVLCSGWMALGVWWKVGGMWVDRTDREGRGKRGTYKAHAASIFPNLKRGFSALLSLWRR